MESIAHWIHKRRAITPERTAIISQEMKYTYKELSRKIDDFAGVFHHKYGLKKGDRVAILSFNRTEYFIAYFAIAQLGLIAVPLNVRLHPEELLFQLQDSGAKMLLYEQATEGIVAELNNLYQFESVYSFDEEFTQRYDAVPPVSINFEHDPYIICYTSGTTGRPKGAVLTQANMFWNALNNQYAIDITSKDITHVILPLFHIGGIGLFAFPTLLAGGAIVVPNKFEPSEVLQEIEKHQITIVMGVPTIFDALRKVPEFQTANLSSVRWFYSGGAPCPKELIEDYHRRGLPLGQGMGMTETSPTIFMLPEEDYKRKVGSIGKPVLFCEIALVDEDDRPVPQGEVGELVVKGPHVFKEYWGLPEQTKETIRNGWLYTGDLMRQDEEGFIYVAGRKKEMIISGGENIYPLEVEQTIYEIEAIGEAAVIGKPDEKWGEVPVAFISFKPNQKIREEEIITFCKEKLASYKVPKTIRIMDSLPKNATGKIDKARLQDLILHH